MHGALLRGGALLLLARVGQVVTGVASLALTARTLGLAGFGDLVTALAVVGLAGGVLGAALSDAAVARSSGALRVLPGLPLGLVLATVAVALLSGIDAAIGVAAGGLFVHASIATAPRVTAARVAGRAGVLAGAQVAGSVGTLLAVGSLVLLDMVSWSVFLAAYALQPLALWLLPTPPDPGGDASAGGWRDVRPFLATQIGWVVVSQSSVLLLRVLEGAEAAGTYGAVLRLLDVLGVLAPLLATLVLPVFVRLAAEPGGERPRAVLNLFVAGASTAFVVGGLQLGWLGWRLLYGELAFPTAIFAVAGAAYGLSAACGLPDRLLQSDGRAHVVAGCASAAAATSVVGGALMVQLFGTVGVAWSSLLVLGLVNLGMLSAQAAPRDVRGGHAGLVLAALLAALAVGSGRAEGSAGASIALALVLLLVVAHSTALPVRLTT